MDRAQYLLVMAACVLATLPLEVVFAARVYRRPARVLRALAGPFVVFWVVDAGAIAGELWDYSRRSTTGWLAPVDVPVEELVFFAVIPLCALLTFEAVRNVEAGRVDRVLARVPPRLLVLVPVGVAAVAAVVLWWQTRHHLPADGWSPFPSALPSAPVRARSRIPEYSVLAVGLVAAVALAEWRWRTGLLGTRAYRSTMLICLAFMVPVNGWLTKLSDPIVVYDPAEFSGWRPIWDIPAEDYLFGIALLTLVLLTWVRAGGRPTAAPTP